MLWCLNKLRSNLHKTSFCWMIYQEMVYTSGWERFNFTFISPRERVFVFVEYITMVNLHYNIWFHNKILFAYDHNFRYFLVKKFIEIKLFHKLIRERLRCREMIYAKDFNILKLYSKHYQYYPHHVICTHCQLYPI